MGRINRPRFGTLQFWPRKRAKKALPRVNWEPVKGEGILGFISYKIGMGTAIVRDKSEKSLTLNKKIAMPVTILQVPKMKIFSVRFYKHGKVMKEIVVSSDKELKRVVKLPKVAPTFQDVEGWTELRVIIYPVTSDLFKKTPDMSEVAVRGANALELVKGLIGKEFSFKDMAKWDLVDVRGLTTGRGFSGPVKRFGITLKSHKSEKGVRRPGSLGPWHPARVTFRAPMAGQVGMFTRVHYNLKVITNGTSDEQKSLAVPHYGKVTGDYIIVAGSVQGPPKRQILITPAMRPTKHTMKKKYEFMELKT